MSHYAPGASNLRDIFVPLDKGVQLRLLTYYYFSETLKDEHGHKINSINVGGRSFPLEISFNTLAFVPIFIWSPEWKPLGADIGINAALPIQHVSSSTRLTNVFSGNVSEDHQSSSGIGDLRLQPLWLTWRFTYFNIGMAYAFYAPTGENRIDSQANIGLGFQSHQFQVPFAVHFNDSKSFSLVGAATYELNHEKSDAHLTPGSHFTMNYGLSKFIPYGKGLFDFCHFDGGSYSGAPLRLSASVLANGSKGSDESPGYGRAGAGEGETVIPAGASSSFPRPSCGNDEGKHEGVWLEVQD